MEGLHIMNKSGGLIYTTDKQAEDNILMVISSSIQSLNEITRNSLSTDYFYQAVEYETRKMHIFRTATGFTFIFIISGKTQNNPVHTYSRVYRHFCEVVLADPFYCLEMPITNPNFHPEKYLGFDMRSR